MKTHACILSSQLSFRGAGTVSLVDDLLRRLEQHASHLEALVEDKTRELEQEKRRSEDLLYQVLPR